MKIKIIEQLFVRYHLSMDSKPSIWFFHGFGDSGLAYREAFDSVLKDHFNLYVVDFPGFGVSPLKPAFSTMKSKAELLTRIILAESKPEQKVNIVAHSLSGLIGTWICQNLEDRINYYLNIEGNLTEADSFFSSQPLAFDTAAEFAASFNPKMFKKAQSEECYKRYYSSLRFANPEAMRNWSLSSQEYVKENICGYEFKQLPCKKLYIWGEKATSEDTQTFIQTHKIPNRLYSGIGHWHMIDNSDQLYSDIYEILK